MNENSATGAGVLTTRTSVAAVTSLVFGIMSPIVLITILPTLITSLMAIVLGHVALVTIRKGRGSVLGRGRALVGLTMGYTFLLIGLFLAPGFFKYPEPTIRTAEQRNMDHAEEMLRAAADEPTYGNSEAAKRLAQKFSLQLSDQVNNSIVRQEHSGALNELNDTLPVFCHLGQNSVCFLVKIPNYHQYEQSARDFLTNAAWRTGVSVAAKSNLPQESKIAIGLKGRLLYGSVAIGSIDSNRPRESDASSRDLKPFFK